MVEFDEPIEAFCVSCREKVEMVEPTPVWTSQGRPGTRGDCPICGATVYRMGKTLAHEHMQPPEAIQVVDQKGIKRNSRAARIKVEAATYIVAAITDADIAEKLSADLNAVGISTWVDNGEEVDHVQWAAGRHPALDQCQKMVVLLSQFTPKTAAATEAWTYFRQQRKPIVVVMTENVEPPDELRRYPRFAIYDDYKRVFRELMQELTK